MGRPLILDLFLLLFCRTVVIIPWPCLGLSGRSSAPTSASSLGCWSGSASTASSTTSTWWTRWSRCSPASPTRRSGPSGTPARWLVSELHRRALSQSLPLLSHCHKHLSCGLRWTLTNIETVENSSNLSTTHGATILKILLFYLERSVLRHLGIPVIPRASSESWESKVACLCLVFCY